MGSFKLPYKRRKSIRRYGYVDGRFQKITEWDYQEFLRMGLKLIIYDKPNINGWNEKIENNLGATIAYKIIVNP